VHAHIRVPYLLLSDTADEGITHAPPVDALLAAPTLRHWWACDNEVLDSPKLDSLPLGVMDSFELGEEGRPQSVAFHANVSAYLATLLAAHDQPKAGWLMMQMSETHAERHRVRATFGRGWGNGEVRLTPEATGKLAVGEYLMALGRHRFVLSPRGNGLDAHRTWEALLVGTVPVVRSSALNPLYARLPVLIVRDWAELTPALLRDFWGNFSARRPYYAWERLFADHWLGAIAVQRERCLAAERAKRAPQYVYDYNLPGGWVALDRKGRPAPTPAWAPDAVKGGR
jgi:hypothetical protein